MSIEFTGKILKQIFFGVLDLLLPLSCLFCYSTVDSMKRVVPICDKHADELKPIFEPCCRYCGRSLRDYTHQSADSDNVQTKSVGFGPTTGPVCGHCRSRHLTLHFTRAGFEYDKVLQAIIGEWKFRANPRIGPWLGTKLSEQLDQSVNTGDCDGLVPIPLHRDRLNERGFNQATQLASRLSGAWNVPVREIITKFQQTEPQSNLSRERRLENVSDAFRVDETVNVTEGKYILIDDIYTTGSTLRSASRTLCQSGATSVGAVVLARA